MSKPLSEKMVLTNIFLKEDVAEAVERLKTICDKNDGYCSIDDINDEFGELGDNKIERKKSKGYIKAEKGLRRLRR